MAKFGGMAAQAPMQVSGPAMASPRPVPRPSASPMPAAPGRGMFGGITPQQRFDMTMSLLQGAMSSAQNTGSPVAAFLAPLATAAIGGSAQSRFNDAAAQGRDDLLSAMVPGGQVSPELQHLYDVANSPDAPDLLKQIATAKLKTMLVPPVVPVGGGSGSGGAKARKSWTDGRYSSLDALMAGAMSDALSPDGDGGANVTPQEQYRLDEITRRREKRSTSEINYNKDDTGDAVGGGAIPAPPAGFTDDF